MVPERASQEVRKKSGVTKTTGCRAGGFTKRDLLSTGARVSKRLLASKSPSTVPLRSKITEPFQASELAHWLRLAYPRLGSRRPGSQPIGTPPTILREKHEFFQSYSLENTPDSEFFDGFHSLKSPNEYRTARTL